MGNASVAARQVRQNTPPGGISQGGESPIQRLRVIFNHLVKYVAEQFWLQLNFFIAPAASTEDERALSNFCFPTSLEDAAHPNRRAALQIVRR